MDQNASSSNISAPSDISDLLSLICATNPLLPADKLLVSMSTPTETLSTLSTLSSFSEQPSNASNLSPHNPVDEFAAALNAAPGQNLISTSACNGLDSLELSADPGFPLVQPPLQLSLSDIGDHPERFGDSTLSPTTPPISSLSAGLPLMLTPIHERRVLRRNTRTATHPYIPRPYESSLARRSTPAHTHSSAANKSNTCIIPAINQDGSYKCCANCMTAETPSWRRHPENQQLLCNACGLYLRLHRKARPITIDESGHIQVIRKNAAVQRSPINLPRSEFRRTSPVSLPAIPFNPYPQYPPLRATASLGSLQGLAEYPAVDLGFNPHVSYPGPPPPPQLQQPQPLRLSEDIMQLHIADARNEFSPAYTQDAWFQGIATPGPSVNIPSTNDSADSSQLIKDEVNPVTN